VEDREQRRLDHREGCDNDVDDDVDVPAQRKAVDELALRHRIIDHVERVGHIRRILDIIHLGEGALC